MPNFCPYELSIREYKSELECIVYSLSIREQYTLYKRVYYIIHINEFMDFLNLFFLCLHEASVSGCGD